MSSSFRSGRPILGHPRDAVRRARRLQISHTTRHDQHTATTAPELVEVQSTRPHGARPPQVAGDDDKFLVSIHAPAWGATALATAASIAALFQSTRPHGARQPSGADGSGTSTCFNPRARMGRDARPGPAAQDV